MPSLAGRAIFRAASRVIAGACAIIAASVVGLAAPTPSSLTVTINPAKVLNTVDATALGGALDGQQKGDTDATYTPTNLTAMASAGLGGISYRLRTELGIEAWHWNAAGAWSQPTTKSGYWTSSATAAQPGQSYGYKLPRRGSTIDQANNDGYSRLDDGDPNTFWKSNPYLDNAYTGDANTAHPQWVVVNLGGPFKLDTLRIAWGDLRATKIAVDVWSSNRNEASEGMFDTFGDEYGSWRQVTATTLDPAAASVQDVRFPAITGQYIRLWLLESAGKPTGHGDPRDQVGYSIREIYAGLMDSSGRLHDDVKHSHDRDAQTDTTASSTDPWHDAGGIDSLVEQPGFDRVFKSGLTGGSPVMMPVGILYDTPDNAAAMLRYLRAHKLPVTQIELGEEPDGQHCNPEDYAALYCEFAKALHAVDPTVQIGGPSFQSSVFGWVFWPDASGDTSWMRRFLAYLKSHGRTQDLAFFTFEWYPFDDIAGPVAQHFTEQPDWFSKTLASLDHDGVPRTIPWYITEYGYSSFAGEAEVDLPGALMDADIACSFLAQGGSRAYFYGWEPNSLITEHESGGQYGNLAMFLTGGDDGITLFPVPAYYETKMLADDWLAPRAHPHEIVAANVTGADANMVTAYACRDTKTGQLAVAIINHDSAHAHGAKFAIGATAPRELDVTQYSREQYVWHVKADDGYARPNLPPTRRHLEPCQPQA